MSDPQPATDGLSTPAATDSIAPDLVNENTFLTVAGEADPATGEVAVQLEAAIQDQGSGLSGGFFEYTLEVESSVETPPETLTFFFDQSNLVDGDSNNGTVLISSTVRPGTWNLTRYFLRDINDNIRDVVVDPLNPIEGWHSFVIAGGGAPFSYLSDGDEPLPLDIQFIEPDSSTDPYNTTLDIDGGSLNIPIAIAATDDVSGIASIYLRFTAPNGQQFTELRLNYPENLWLTEPPDFPPYLEYSNSLDGTYAGSLLLSPFSQEGRWDLNYIYLTDQAGNALSLNDYNGQLAAYLSGRVPSFTVFNTNSDIAAPEISDIDIGPGVVDITDDETGNDVLTITVDFSDSSGLSLNDLPTGAISGISDVTLWFTSDGPSRQIRSVSLSANQPDKIIDGDSTVGTLQGILELPDSASDGTWTLTGVQIRDIAGNYRYLSDYPSPDSLTSQGLARSFTFITDTPDITAPDINDVTINLDTATAIPSRARTNAGATSLPVSITAVDAGSGIESISAWFRSPSGLASLNVYLTQDDFNQDTNTFEGSLTLPAYAEQGRWLLESLSVSDQAGNWSYAYRGTGPQSLSSYGLGTKGFIAGDFVEWSQTRVKENSSAEINITASNQIPDSPSDPFSDLPQPKKLYFTLVGENGSIDANDIEIVPSSVVELDEANPLRGWVTISSEGQAKINVRIKSDNAIEGDEWLYVDLYESDAVNAKSVGESAAIRILDPRQAKVNLSNPEASGILASADWLDASGLSNANFRFRRINLDETPLEAELRGSGYFDYSFDAELTFSEYYSLVANSERPRESHYAVLAAGQVQEAGIYELVSIGISDNSSSGNYRWYTENSGELDNYLQGRQLDKSVFSFEAFGTAPDGTEIPEDQDIPLLTSFAWDAWDQESSADILALDDGTGLLQASASFSDATGLEYASLTFRSKQNILSLDFSSWITRLADDTTSDQQHLNWLRLPKGTASGTYQLDSLSLGDRAGNYGNVSSSELEDYFSDVVASLYKDANNSSALVDDIINGFTFTVTEEDLVTPPVDDDKAPELVAISLSSISADLATGSSPILHARISDESGLRSARFKWLLEGDGATSVTFSTYLNAESSLVSSTAESEIQDHSGLVTPSQAGTYALNSIELEDIYGNRRLLENLTPGNVNDTFPDLTFTSEGEPPAPSDNLAPSLEDFSLTSLTAEAGATQTFNVSGGSGKIWIEFDFSDAGGVLSPNTDPDSYIGSVELIHSNGVDTIWQPITAQDLFSGDQTSGSFKIGINTPSSTLNGVWSVNAISLQDNSGNERYLRADDSSGSSLLARELLARRLGASNGRSLAVEVAGGSNGTINEQQSLQGLVPRIEQASFDKDSINIGVDETGELTLIIQLNSSDYATLIEDGLDEDGYMDNSSAVIINKVSGQRLFARFKPPEPQIGEEHKLTATFQIDANTVSGDWLLSEISLLDDRYISGEMTGGGYFPSDLDPELHLELLSKRLGVADPSALRVNITGDGRPGPTEDRLAPRITGAKFDPLQYLNGVGQATLTIAYLDSGQGLDLQSGWLGEIALIHEDGQTWQWFDLSSNSENDAGQGSTAIVSQAADGELSIVMPINQALKAGLWHLAAIRLQDAAGNQTELELLRPNGNGSTSAFYSGLGYYSDTPIDSSSLQQFAERIGATNISNISFNVATGSTTEDTLAPRIEGLRVSAESTPDIQPPTLSSAATNQTGTKILLTYSEVLSSRLPSTNRFNVLVNGTTRSVASITSTTNVLELTLGGTPISSNQTVSLTYGDPTPGNDAYAIQDQTGNDAASLPITTVSNQVNPSGGSGGGGSGGSGGGGGGGAPTPPVLPPPAPIATPPQGPPEGRPRSQQQDVPKGPPPLPDTANSIAEVKTSLTQVNLEQIKAKLPFVNERSFAVVETLVRSPEAVVTRANTAAPNDPIIGGNSADVILPPAGRNTLIGAGGSDTFGFIEADKFGKRGADRITDFNPRDGDKIVLSDAAFPGLEQINFQVVRSKSAVNRAFSTGSNIIYDLSTGSIYFDSNGDAPGRGIGGVFATIPGRPRLSAEDFALLPITQLLN